MDASASRHRLPPPPTGWLLLAIGVSGWIVALVRGLGDARAHGYPLTPPSPNAWALLTASARDSLLVGLVALAVLWVPWRWACDRRRPSRALGWVWGTSVALLLWGRLGYRYNRFEIGALWRETVAWGGASIPAALTEAGPLLHNAGLTFAAVLLAVALAWVVGRAMPRLAVTPAARGSSGTGLALLALLVPAALLPASWSRPEPAGPDVILISLDAVRADRLGCYGYDRPTTPALDRFAQESERYARAYCQEPWTLTSHMSMLTGLYPDVHGLDFGRSLAPAVWTLPEVLRESGYRTWGSVYDCFLLDPRFGYAAGFDHYAVNEHPARRRCRDAARWILSDTRPTFVFLHLYDTHSDRGLLPYEASAPFRQRLAPGAAEGFAAWTGVGGASETLRRVNEEGFSLPDSLRLRLSQLYDAGLAETDDAVGELLERLRSAGRLDDALIIVLSDHGEALGEQNHFMHERLMEATLRIPWLVHWPQGDRAGTVRGDLVETVDLMPTVLEVVGCQAPQVVQGGSLVTGRTERRAAFSRSGLEYAITTDEGWRLVYERPPGAIGQPLTLRRVGADPADGPDLMADHPSLVAELMELTVPFHRANEVLARRFSGGRVELSESDAELLRSLGYLE